MIASVRESFMSSSSSPRLRLTPTFQEGVPRRTTALERMRRARGDHFNHRQEDHVVQTGRATSMNAMRVRTMHPEATTLTVSVLTA